MERDIYALRKKEKDSTNRLFRITSNFRKLEERREKNLNKMRLDIKNKKNEINRLEKCLSQQIETSRLNAGESLLTSKKSAFIAKSMENQTEIMLGKIVELEKKNDRMRMQQRNLFGDLIDEKRQHQEDISILYSVFFANKMQI
jgi:hypothetical protein